MSPSPRKASPRNPRKRTLAALAVVATSLTSVAVLTAPAEARDHRQGSQSGQRGQAGPGVGQGAGAGVGGPRSFDRTATKPDPAPKSAAKTEKSEKKVEKSHAVADPSAVVAPVASTPPLPWAWLLVQAPRRIDPGASATITGTLKANGQPLAGQSVTLYAEAIEKNARVWGRFGWHRLSLKEFTEVETAQTDANGVVTFTVTPDKTSIYRLVAPKSDAHRTAASWIVAIRVKAAKAAPTPGVTTPDAPTPDAPETTPAL